MVESNESFEVKKTPNIPEGGGWVITPGLLDIKGKG